MLLVLLAFSALYAAAQAPPLPAPNLCFGFLKAVPNRPNLPEAETQRIQAAHIAHLTALGEKRWLLAAGPIGTPGPIRGILISACKSIEEANELASADPAVRQGRLMVETFRWTGPEGIANAYWTKREANPKAEDKMAKHALVLVRRSGNGKMPAAEAWARHETHLDALRRTGMLAAAGPVHPPGDLVFVMVLRNTPLDRARQIAEADPLFESGALIQTLEWWVADDVLP